MVTGATGCLEPSNVETMGVTVPCVDRARVGIKLLGVIDRTSCTILSVGNTGSTTGETTTLSTQRNTHHVVVSPGVNRRWGPYHRNVKTLPVGGSVRPSPTVTRSTWDQWPDVSVEFLSDVPLVSWDVSDCTSYCHGCHRPVTSSSLSSVYPGIQSHPSRFRTLPPRPVTRVSGFSLSSEQLLTRKNTYVYHTSHYVLSLSNRNNHQDYHCNRKSQTMVKS